MSRELISIPNIELTKLNLLPGKFDIFPIRYESIRIGEYDIPVIIDESIPENEFRLIGNGQVVRGAYTK
jgi:hypothetical protein